MRRMCALLVAALPAVVSAQDVRLDFLYTITSPPNVMHFGRSVLVIDDVNNDTFPEFAVAASNAAGGIVFLFSGFDGALLGSFESPKEAPFIDAELMDTFARSMAMLPDVDGDGVPDLLIGAPHHAAPGAQPLDGLAGVVYVVNPATMTVVRTLTSPSAIRDGLFGWAVDAFRGNQPTDLRGIMVGAPGEFGVPNHPFSNAFAGRAHLFNGATGAHLHTYINPTELSGEEATLGNFGHSVATPSGTYEAYIGEPGANFSTNTFVNTGRIYKYVGFNQTFFAASPLRVVTNARFGENMVVVPNINRDNGILPDVLIGVPNSFPEDLSQSFGRAQAMNFEAFNRVNIEYVSPTPQTNSAFGAAVAGILDISGNSRGELAIGQQRLGTDPEGELTDLAGYVHLFDSNSNALLVTLPRSGEPQIRGQFGAAISGTRDVHAAFSRRRMIVGAPGTGFPGSPPAKLYVYKMRSRRTGDLNNDFQINQTDINLMESFLAGNIQVTQPVILDVLDVTNDGVIDSRDLDALRIIVFGPGDPFPSAWVVQ
ncbi:MAG: FG-GAP repeat protein [Candidatus Sumerlaeia bacterium]|nr:FG-GAP repeat protein [Candidatus Sumerlaeia bacterium]